MGNRWVKSTRMSRFIFPKSGKHFVFTGNRSIKHQNINSDRAADLSCNLLGFNKHKPLLTPNALPFQQSYILCEKRRHFLFTRTWFIYLRSPSSLSSSLHLQHQQNIKSLQFCFILVSYKVVNFNDGQFPSCLVCNEPIRRWAVNALRCVILRETNRTLVQTTKSN